MDIRAELTKRILILDGATGTALQKFNLSEEAFRGRMFTAHEALLKGNNDILTLTCPEVIRQVHDEYIAAGADIIETNTFSSNAVSQAEYRCSKWVAELNRESVRIAKDAARACTDRKVFVAGSIGPTSKSLTLAPDAGHPERRAIDFDTMAVAYAEQVDALITAGVDLLLVETIFDTLNAKAALYAIARVQAQRATSVPVMVSVTVNDRQGRILTGQSLEAVYTSLRHYPLLSFGLNCSFGATDLERLIKELSAAIPEYISIYPNAGLPNEMGDYDEDPPYTAGCLRRMADQGLINIAGGCCGTTPAHIAAIARALRGCLPRRCPNIRFPLIVSGLETITVDVERRNFINIGERTNVAGSAKFARLIREKQYADAAEIARRQVDDGASIIDINMDDAMLDGTAEMETFVRLISNEPDIAKAALMIDSSKWETIIAGLKNAPGKCIVNSISLKEGEAEFLKKAKELRSLGAAVVVMAFDEQGQAVDYVRKINIARRAFQLLTTRADFAPEDIIFDVNVLTVATGIEEHNHYGVDFIEAVRWIKQNLPGCRTSAGVSNLSFAFRGNNPVREAMHSAFLYHAIRAGLDMAIVNPSLLQVYDSIAPELLQAVEDVILNRRPDATDILLALAEKYRAGKTEVKHTATDQWREGTVDERLIHALVKGVTGFLADDLREALTVYPAPVDIIEKPLMAGMERVGQFFSEGKMFLPQIVKSAKVMKEAVQLLQPEIERYNSNHDNRQVQRPKIVTATVKGDVHDIGKNIVNIVLSCNNLEVIDLGVMVDNRTILQAVKEHQSDFVAVSGLITPSLAEMEGLCRLLQEAQCGIPLLVGGATTSSVHTAVKLAPLYDYCVIHGGDASHTAGLVQRLLKDRDATIADIKAKQKAIRRLYSGRKQTLVPLPEARRRAPHLPAPPDTGFGQTDLFEPDVDLRLLTSYIDWAPFFHFWNFKGTLETIRHNAEAGKLFKEAGILLDNIISRREFHASAIVRFFDACTDHDTILIAGGRPLAMLRQQSENSEYLCLSDFLPPKGTGMARIGLFTLVVCDTAATIVKDDMEKLLRESLCARLTEACAVWLQEQIFGNRHGIRPAFGYPACPDHALKKDVFDMLQAEDKLDIALTDSYAIIPTTSICGLFMVHPDARYFSVGHIDRDQIEDYCERRGIREEELGIAN
ncbi:MAG: methionine synthase [Prevotellaceae bacterium]|jgi:5-methyltetrahydrofolate--homocysteine methyltransferase|nr:methionine synthase [Prevotellaceae bacterium]